MPSLDMTMEDNKEQHSIKLSFLTMEFLPGNIIENLSVNALDY
jgi:hypothetical protein